MGELMEGILKDKMIEHLVQNNLINKSQHGFMSKRSCLTNLLEFLEFVTEAVDHGELVDAIYLHFQKAFDNVPYVRLLDKIKARGITGKILSWLANWLSGRQQWFVLNGNVSKWLLVLSGVPQGSILGPLLCVIFSNDIDAGIVSKLLKFADDTKMATVVSSEEGIEKLQSDLKKLYQWACDWQMLFNVDKCKVIHFGHSNDDGRCVYTLGSYVVKVVKEERDLGVIVHKSLKPTSQCIEAVKSANK